MKLYNKRTLAISRTSMLKLLCLTALLLCLLPAFGRTASDSIRINIAVFAGAKPEKVSILVEIANFSGETKTTLKHGRVDYVNGRIKPVGNYIVEVEKLENENFVPFPPTADRDPVFQKDYREVKPDKGFVETIDLDGRSWSSKGFPQGRYRVRIAFNWDEWNDARTHLSKWVTFTID